MGNKTAVEWFMENLPNRLRNSILNGYRETLDTAIQMEKEQIMNSFVDGGYVDTNLERQSSEQYFEELYGK
jgi:hypothetical protein